jgi:hypothetical protein
VRICAPFRKALHPGRGSTGASRRATIADPSNRRQQAFDFRYSDTSDRPDPEAWLLAKFPRINHEPHLAQTRIKFLKPEFRIRRIAVSRDDLALVFRRKERFESHRLNALRRLHGLYLDAVNARHLDNAASVRPLTRTIRRPSRGIAEEISDSNAKVPLPCIGTHS